MKRLNDIFLHRPGTGTDRTSFASSQLLAYKSHLNVGLELSPHSHNTNCGLFADSMNKLSILFICQFVLVVAQPGGGRPPGGGLPPGSGSTSTGSGSSSTAVTPNGTDYFGLLPPPPFDHGFQFRPSSASLSGRQLSYQLMNDSFTALSSLKCHPILLRFSFRHSPHFGIEWHRNSSILNAP
jgi:hypothetical protein